MIEIHPCTIINDRYHGVYSGGTWTAWNLDSELVPTEIDTSDTECNVFWQENKIIVGLGNTPAEAYIDLAMKLNKGD